MAQHHHHLPCSVCDTTTSTCCKVCVQTALAPTVEAHRVATQNWRAARAAVTTSTQTTVLPELQDTSLRLRNEMDSLRKQCAAAAVQVCAWKVRNHSEDNNQFAVSPSTIRPTLHRLEDSVIGTLELQIRAQEDRIRRLRFQWAKTAFWMHRVEVKYDQQKVDEAKIGKIGGLPLPHVELFGVLPPAELQSALRLVAVLTYTVAQCLAIPLPHPILLHGQMDPDEVDVAVKNPTPTTARAPPQQSISLARAAVLRESRDRLSQPYSLVFQNNNDEFATAWQFLQNNTIALAIRAGVPVSRLHSGEAVLLNLHALQEYCVQQATAQPNVLGDVDDTGNAKEKRPQSED